MIRHLVLPGYAEESRKIADFLASEIPGDPYIHLMSQYRPEYRAREHPLLREPLKEEAFLEVVEIFQRAGLHPVF
jgi:putative pyruvate formate lyase activating enzyme